MAVPTQPQHAHVGPLAQSDGLLWTKVHQTLNILVQQVTKNGGIASGVKTLNGDQDYHGLDRSAFQEMANSHFPACPNISQSVPAFPTLSLHQKIPYFGQTFKMTRSSII